MSKIALADTTIPIREPDSSIKSDAIKILYELWVSENSVKTAKLSMFFLVQSIFVTVFCLRPVNALLICSMAMAFSFIWFFCIGRTVAFQKYWKKRIDDCVRKLPSDMRDAFDFYPAGAEKGTLPLYGRMPSKYILLWPPCVAFLMWFGLLIHAIAK